jgi:steroid delta-isomerase-like uncharacterized protein
VTAAESSGPDRLDRHKRLVRRFYDEIWNHADLSAVPEILAPDVTFRGSLGSATVGLRAFVQYVRSVTGALDDYRCDIADLVAEADRVVARMTFSGIHRGPLLGVPASGRRVSWDGAAFFTIADGRVVDLWVLGDLAGLRAQLDAVADH